jgi:predicted transcriptional regulator
MRHWSPQSSVTGSGTGRDAEQRGRAAVAEQVRALVARSGVSRAEFASRIGTSRPRLSTYCTGSVTPSDALVERMRALVERMRALVDRMSAG